MKAGELTAELLRELSVIEEDEALMKKALNYIKKLTAKKTDPTLMTKEEFLAKLERGEEEYRQGKTFAMLPGETFAEFRKRIGR